MGDDSVAASNSGAIVTGRELAALSGQESIVVIRRPFVHWLGNIGRALLFDQILFEGNARGGEWFAVSDTEWQNRLLLSRREIRDARDHLVGLGVLETKSEGMPRRMWYKLDADKAALLFTAFVSEAGASTLEWPNGRTRLVKRAVKSDQMATHSIQGVEGDGKVIPVGEQSANGALAPVATLPQDTLKPRAARKPKAQSEPDPLVWEIAQALTGRPEVQPRDGGLIYPVVADIRALVGTDETAGLMAWSAFREAREAAKTWDRVKPYNARNDFGRWAANGGAPEIEAIRADVARRAGSKS